MKNLYRKAILITIIVIFLLPGIIAGAEEQDVSSKNNEILTEIRVDVKYIKENIQSNREDIKELKRGFSLLDKRITLQEERNIYITDCIDRVDKRDGWLLGIIGTLMTAVLIMQIKRSRSHRKEDEENGELDN